MRMPEEFRDKVKEKHITYWENHDCVLCGHSVGYYFENDTVYFDGNCDCTIYHSSPRCVGYQGVADHYNMQSHPEVIAKMNEFWGFTDDNN